MGRSISKSRLLLKIKKLSLRLHVFMPKSLRTQLKEKDTNRCAPTSKLNTPNSLPRFRLRKPPLRNPKERKRPLLSRRPKKSSDKNRRRLLLPPRLLRLTSLSSRSKRLLVSPRKLKRESLLSRARSRLRESNRPRSPSKLLPLSIK